MDFRLQATSLNTITVWRVVDGKRGHERQTEGLIQALSQILPLTVVVLPPLSFWQACWLWLTALVKLNVRSAPDLIIGAGHATHMTLIAYKKKTGAKSIVLMKPSLPCRWFDLCVVPKHDHFTGGNVIQTNGALNAMNLSNMDIKQTNTGLILIGGESKHYEWDTQSVILQLMALIHQEPKRKWRLSTSRRTPEDFASALKRCDFIGQLEMVEYDEVDDHWLPTQLTDSEVVWLTPDSVSMLYESLTAGCAVGVFDLNASSQSDIADSVNRLAMEHKIIHFKTWRDKQVMPSPSLDFNEAIRVAQRIKRLWFPKH